MNRIRIHSLPSILPALLLVLPAGAIFAGDGSSATSPITITSTDWSSYTQTINSLTPYVLDGSLYYESSDGMDFGTNSVVVGYENTTGTSYLTLSGGTYTSSSNSTCSLNIGDSAGSSGVVVVDGASTSLTISNTINVGESGTGLLTVSGGANVSIEQYYLQIGSSSNDNTVEIKDSGSTLLCSYAMIGIDGKGTLNVTNGGTLTTLAVIVGAYTANATGTMTVSGTGSTATGISSTPIQLVYVGMNGTGISRSVTKAV
jgi:T5SS/PEP-CTERM-associated repeat protein